MARSYSFTTEPRGAIYSELLAFALGRCDVLSVVIRPREDLSDAGRTLLDDLQPHVIWSDPEATEWPGTVLLSGSVTLLHARFNEATRDLIGSAAQGLYDWRQPRLPEDLALLRESGQPLLGSIAHEQDAFLRLSTNEMNDLRQDAPTVLAILTGASSQ